MVSVVTTQLGYCSAKVGHRMNEHISVPIRLHLQNQEAGQIWPNDCGLLIPKIADEVQGV